MNQPKTTLRFMVHAYFLILVVWLGTGCSQGGPTLPVESIDSSLPEPLKNAMTGLYDWYPDDVIVSIRSIGDMGPEASPATPYLSSMLTDSRLGTSWTGGYGKKIPVSKVAAMALGQIGEAGIIALSDALMGIEQAQGMKDDLLRESVAKGLNTAMETWGEIPFKCLQGTERVAALIHTARVCFNLEDSPGRLDDTDPRRSLKYFKHFDETDTREGLKYYIKALGYTGDTTALDLLESVFPLSANKQKQADQRPAGPFETASVIAQYRILPLPLADIHPPCADILIIEFTATGDQKRVDILLDQGMNPDILTQMGHPLIELAWKQKHPNLFETLINHGAQVNFRLSGQKTLLMRASKEGDHEFVKALLDHGADPALTNRDKQTAIEVAVSELMSFWNGKPHDTDAKPYFIIIENLQAAGSPPVNEKILKEIDKKSREFLKL